MSKNLLIASVFLLSLIGSQACGDSEVLKRPFPLAIQSFQIPCSGDTLLRTREGIEIQVPAQAFDCEAGQVALHIAPVVTKGDMVKYAAYTLTAEGKPLETAGMFYFKSSVPVAENKALLLRMPAEGLNADMQWFRSEDGQNWELQETKVESPQEDLLVLGEQLYEEKCSSCHSTYMRKDLTGPALGNIHLYRDFDWFKRFTKRSQQMIAEGDSLAELLWWQWKPTIMNNFGHSDGDIPNRDTMGVETVLKDKDFRALYLYIAQASAEQNLAYGEANPILPENVDSLYAVMEANNAARLAATEAAEAERLAAMEKAMQEANRRVIRVRQNQEPAGPVFVNNNPVTANFIERNFGDPKRYLMQYQSRLQNDGWYNFDAIINAPLVETPVLTVKSPRPKEVVAILVYENRRIVLPFEVEGERQRLLESWAANEQMAIPEGLVQLVAYRLQDGKIVEAGFRQAEITAENNSFELRLEATNAQAFAARLAAL